MNAQKIITVGFNPVWDKTCYVDGLEWGDHKIMASQTLMPAGKSLNINKALAWMSVSSTAAGLWGIADHSDMTEVLSEYKDYIKPAFTVVKGRTRQNVTVVDTRQNREIHLRSSETLVTPVALTQLVHDLLKQLNSKASIIFAGSMPEGPLQDECVSIVTKAGSRCSRLIVDTSGSALKKIVNNGNISIIKPNLEELSELLDESIDNDAVKVATAARCLCDQIEVVIVSLGQQGAVAVTKDTTVYCRLKNHHHQVVNTVGCGDYLLAGYVSVSDTEISKKLITGIKAATAKAYGWVGNKSWSEAEKNIEVEMISF
jgi:1-phosphofructokinase family hexose kinase